MIGMHLGASTLMVTAAMRWPFLIPITMVGAIVTTPGDLSEYPLQNQAPTFISQASPHVIHAVSDSTDGTRMGAPAIHAADSASVSAGPFMLTSGELPRAEPRVLNPVRDTTLTESASENSYLAIPATPSTPFDFSPVINMNVEDAQLSVVATLDPRDTYPHKPVAAPTPTIRDGSDSVPDNQSLVAGPAVCKPQDRFVGLCR